MKRLVVRRRTILLVTAGLIVALIWLFQATLTHPIDSFHACAEAGNPVTDGNPPVCRDGKHTIRGPVASAAPSSEAWMSVPFDILVDGNSGGTYPRQQEVITTQADWQHYWQTVHAALPALPPLIPVDFSATSVVALSEGVETTTGYSYKVTGIETGSTGTRVDVTESIPSISCPVQQTPQNRYFIVRTGHLAPPVSFTTTTQHRHCP